MSARICEQCDSDVLFARTRDGKFMPLDPARLPPDDESANVAVYRDHNGSLRCRVLKKDDELEPFEWRAMTHFATCKARLAQAGKLRDQGVVPFRRPKGSSAHDPTAR